MCVPLNFPQLHPSLNYSYTLPRRLLLPGLATRFLTHAPTRRHPPAHRFLGVRGAPGGRLRSQQLQVSVGKAYTRAYTRPLLFDSCTVRAGDVYDKVPEAINFRARAQNNQLRLLSQETPYQL